MGALSLLVLLAGAAAAQPAAWSRITFSGVGPHGVFDPSLESTGTRVWMSYSALRQVAPNPCPADPSPNVVIETRLAASDDEGATWTDAGALNTTTDVCVGANPPNQQYASFVREVSSLVHDPTAPASERWKNWMMTYPVVDDGVAGNDDRIFTQLWIGLKTAADPAGPWSTERKAFVGSAYDAAADAVLGAPERRLNLLDAALSDCLVFGEPGALGASAGMYLALTCHTATVGQPRVILIRLAGGATTYHGELFRHTDASAFGYSAVEAVDLWQDGGRTFALASMTSTDALYRGCFGFEVEDLASARLRRDVSGRPILLWRQDGTSSMHNGACGYEPRARRSGVLHGQADFSAAGQDWFRLYATHLHPVALTASTRTATFSLPAGVSSVTVPSGALDSDAAVLVARAAETVPGATAGASLRPTGVAVELASEVPLRAGAAASLTLAYRPSDVSGLSESRLTLARWDGAAWLPVPSAPEPANDRVTAAVDRLGLYQVMEAEPKSDLSSVRAFPNPFRPSAGHAFMSFADLPAGARVRVHSMSGALVRELSADAAGLAQWDGADRSGRRAPSGVYAVLVEGGGRTRRLKAALQR